MHFQKSYICSNELDVQETNCCFSQLNRIRNHLFGRWIEIGRDSGLWDLIVCVLGNTIQFLERPVRPVVTNENQRSKGMINVLFKTLL